MADSKVSSKKRVIQIVAAVIIAAMVASIIIAIAISSADSSLEDDNIAPELPVLDPQVSEYVRTNFLKPCENSRIYNLQGREACYTWLIDEFICNVAEGEVSEECQTEQWEMINSYYDYVSR